MTRVENFAFIGRGGMFWDRGDIFSKINDPGSHWGTPHRGIRTGCFKHENTAKLQNKYVALFHNSMIRHTGKQEPRTLEDP